MRHLLIISRIHIQNANALSSPYTIGFPAMTAWLGAMHALERKLNQLEKFHIGFKKLGVCCHRFDLQTYKGRGDFVHSIIATGNPLDKDGERPSFIEEPRCHLEASLVIEYEGLDPDEKDVFLKAATTYLYQMKIAGGDILSFSQLECVHLDEDQVSDLKSKILNKLMLGHVLIERRDLMKKTNENEDALDKLLEHLKIRYRSTQEEDNKVSWTVTRKSPGWIVPIAVGFQGISAVGLAKNQRDETTPHRFAESVITLGEFIMPYRIQKLDDMLWQYHVDQKHHLYLCQNQTNI